MQNTVVIIWKQVQVLQINKYINIYIYILNIFDIWLILLV